MFSFNFGHRPRSPADFWSRQMSLLGNNGPAAKQPVDSTPQSGERIRVPRGHCWVEGDNAAVSHDSNRFGPVRYTHRLSLLCLCFSFPSRTATLPLFHLHLHFASQVPLGLVVSRATHIIWPPSRWRRLTPESDYPVWRAAAARVIRAAHSRNGH